MLAFITKTSSDEYYEFKYFETFEDVLDFTNHSIIIRKDINSCKRAWKNCMKSEFDKWELEIAKCHLIICDGYIE